MPFLLLLVISFISLKGSDHPSYTTFQDRGSYVFPALVKITPGHFMMGSNKEKDEQPIHQVDINRSFYIGKYEVTIIEFKKFIQETKSEHTKVYTLKENKLINYYEKEDIINNFRGEEYPYSPELKYYRSFCKDRLCPIMGVTYDDAIEYAKWLSKKTGKTFRLPTESEWEYVAHAGTTGEQFFDVSKENLDNYAWYRDNSGATTHKVGSKKPNPWGVYDIYGNVWEWCQDNYDKNYTQKPKDGTAHYVWRTQEVMKSIRMYDTVDKEYEINNGLYILRGGSWNTRKRYMRSAQRFKTIYSYYGAGIGFRLVMEETK